MGDTVLIETTADEVVSVVTQGPQGPSGSEAATLTTVGDTLYRGVSAPQRLPIGTPGQVLKVNNTATAPEWGATDAVDLTAPGPIGSVTPNTGAFTTLSASGTATLPHIHGSLAGNLYIHVKNVSGGELTRGTPVYIVGNVGDTDRVEVAAADFDDATKMPAVGLLEQTLANNGSGDAIILGELDEANTNAYTINQELFVGNNGTLTATRPTTGQVQSAGIVARVNSNTGVIVVNMQGQRSPNETFAAASHTHGNITNDGKVGTTANLPLKTGTSGVIEAGAFGAAAGSFCEGNDARLSDDRDPNLHAASHAAGGTDALAPSDIGAQSIFTASDTFLAASPTTLTAGRAQRITVSTVVASTTELVLPTSSNQNGDMVQIIRSSSGANQSIVVKTSAGGSTLADLGLPADAGRSFTFRYVTGPNTWLLVPIDSHPADRITSGTLDVARLPVGTGSTQVAAGNHTHVVADVTGAAASGSITTSGLTQATARILGRTTASTGAIEEIQIGSGLSLSAGELSSTVSAGIPATILDAKGDLIVASAADTAARLAVGGTNGHVLTVDSTETLGVKWAAAAGGVGGGTGSTDNSILRSDGTGGSTVQASAIVIEDAVSPINITGDAGTDIITAVGHTYTANQGVRFPTLTGGAGLTAATTNYFVRDISGDTFRVSTTSGGGAVNFTTNITAGTVIAMQANVALVNNSADTISALVLSPKGSEGAIIVGPRPDGTATGGNPRGNWAVDLQLRKTAATNVASGQESALLGGRFNTASGNNSVIVGSVSATASGDSSIVISSNNSTASASRAMVLCGDVATASAPNSIAIGPYSLADRNCMIAHSAFVPNSAGNTQAANFPLWGRFISRSATGTDSDDIITSNAHGFSANQSVRFLTLTGGSNLSASTSYFVRDVTTNTFRVALTAGGTALNLGSDITAATIAADELSNSNLVTGRITIPSGKGFACMVQVMGNRSDGATHCHFIQRYMLKNVAGTTTEVTAAETLGTNTANGVSLFIAADDNSDAMTVKVQIPTGETWRFAGYVYAVEVAYGT
jgi:hypothetical protein